MRLRRRSHSSRRDNFDLSKSKNAPIFRSIFLFISWRTTKFAMRASEVIFDSEVHFVSEVSPIGEVANLTSIVRSTNFTVLRTTSLLPRQKLHLFPIISEHLGHCNTEITSNIYVHIFKEYKAKMAESIDHTLV